MNAFISVVLMLFLVPAPTRQQPATRIKVQLTGTCTYPEKVHLVMNGDEDHAREITLKNGVYEDKWSVHPGDYASLRMGGRRTGIRSYEIEPDSAPPVAVFKFECDVQSTITEHIESSSSTNLTYCRKLPKHQASRDGLDWEKNEFGDGKAAILIADWRFRNEKVWLLPATMHNCQVPGLSLDAVPGIKPPEHPPLTLRPDRIIEALCRPRNAPNCLEAKAHPGFENLTLFVTPRKQP